MRESSETDRVHVKSAFQVAFILVLFYDLHHFKRADLPIVVAERLVYSVQFSNGNCSLVKGRPYTEVLQRREDLVFPSGVRPA